MGEKVLYVKGGYAVQEARELFPRLGELPDGGPDKFLLAVIYYTQKARLRLVTFDKVEQSANMMGHEIHEYRARTLTGNSFYRRFIWLSSLIRFFRDTLAFRPDRVLCGLDGPVGIVAWLATRLSGAQFVFLVHNALNISSVSVTYRVINKFLCRHSDRILTHGPFLRQEALACGGAESMVVEFQNGLDISNIEFLKNMPPKVASTENFTIAYVGRIEIDKGALDLLQAFINLAPGRQVKLKYVGSGGAVAALHEMAAKAGVADRVEVLGPIPFGEVFMHLRDATVVVTPSRSSFPEGLCKTAMEAFFVGTPVIGPDYGPFPLVITDGKSGLLYQADSVESLEKTMVRFFDTPGLRGQLESGALEVGRLSIKPKTSFHEAIRDLFSDEKPAVA